MSDYILPMYANAQKPGTVQTSTHGDCTTTTALSKHLTTAEADRRNTNFGHLSTVIGGLVGSLRGPIGSIGGATIGHLAAELGPSVHPGDVIGFTAKLCKDDSQNTLNSFVMHDHHF